MSKLYNEFLVFSPGDEEKARRIFENCGFGNETVTERNQRNEIRRLKDEVNRLNKMRVHCEYCGGDYLMTGIECGCPCRLIARIKELEGRNANKG